MIQERMQKQRYRKWLYLYLNYFLLGFSPELAVELATADLIEDTTPNDMCLHCGTDRADCCGGCTND